MVTIADFAAFDWEQVLDPHPKKVIYEFEGALRRKAFEARNSGDTTRAEVFEFLTEVASFLWEPGSAGEPFKPRITLADGKRSRIPTDYSDHEADLLKALSPTVRDPEMRGRIADVVWERCRDHVSAEIAVGAYLESATRLEHPEDWVNAARRIERALQIALALRNKTLREIAVSHAESVLARYGGNDPSFLSAYLMKLLLRSGEGDAAHYAALADHAGKNAASSRDWRRTRDYLGIKAQWLHRARKTQEAAAAEVEAAETFVKEADLAEAAATPNFMLVVHHLGSAIQALRAVPGQRARVDELHRRLLSVQPHTLTQMARVQIPLPAPEEAIQRAVDAVTGKSFEKALVALACISRSPSVDQLRQISKEAATLAPISDTVGHDYLTAEGKTAARTPGASASESDEDNPALRSWMFRHADFIRVATAQAIDSARMQMVLEHPVCLGDWDNVVFGNPFVPLGREQFFARGLHAGLTGDFVVAAHLLIPQVENSCRQLLASRGATVSTFDRDGIQRELYIYELLPKPEFKQLFGENLTFDLRGLLVEQQSSNLRHGMVHGLFDYVAFQSPPSLYLWWLILQLVCLPVLSRLAPKEEALKSDSGSETANKAKKSRKATKSRKPKKGKADA